MKVQFEQRAILTLNTTEGYNAWERVDNVFADTIMFAKIFKFDLLRDDVNNFLTTERVIDGIDYQIILVFRKIIEVDDLFYYQSALNSFFRFNFMIQLEPKINLPKKPKKGAV
jgi:hypothetical protein